MKEHLKSLILAVVIILAVAILVFPFSSQAGQGKSQFKSKRTGEDISIIKCVFDKSANFWIGTKHEITGNNLIDAAILYITNIFNKSTRFTIGDEQADFDTIHDKNFSFIISGLDTDEPKMKGNFGETPLNILWKTENTIYLAEITPGKNAINYITLFPKRGIVIFSKQYIFLPSGKGEITAYMSVGHFE